MGVCRKLGIGTIIADCQWPRYGEVSNVVGVWMMRERLWLDGQYEYDDNLGMKVPHWASVITRPFRLGFRISEVEPATATL